MGAYCLIQIFLEVRKLQSPVGRSQQGISLAAPCPATAQILPGPGSCLAAQGPEQGHKRRVPIASLGAVGEGKRDAVPIWGLGLEVLREEVGERDGDEREAGAKKRERAACGAVREESP